MQTGSRPTVTAKRNPLKITIMEKYLVNLKFVEGHPDQLDLFIAKDEVDLHHKAWMAYKRYGIFKLEVLETYKVD